MGLFLPRGQWGSDATQEAGLWLVSGFSLRRECSALFQNGSSFPSLVGGKRGFFSDTCCGNLMEVLKGNFTKRCGGPYDWASEVLTLRLVLTEAPAVPLLSPRFPAPLLVSALHSRESLRSPICLSILGDGRLLCGLASLVGPRKVDCTACPAFYFL